MKPRPERTKTETKAEKRAETRMGPLRGVVRAGRIGRVRRETFYTLWPFFYLRFKLTVMILDPCQQTSPPFALSFQDFSAQNATYRRTEDKKS
jgi:hypothetical protein